MTSTPTLTEARPTVFYGLAEASRRFFDEPPHPSALIRWGTKGTKLRNGQCHKLVLKRQPGKWLVSEVQVSHISQR